MTTTATIGVNPELQVPLPEWGLRWLTPELHNTGHANIDPAAIGECGDGMAETAIGSVLYGHLTKTECLTRCLSLQDGISLMARPELLVPPHFTGTRILLCRSAMIGTCKNLFIPFIQIIRGQPPHICYWWFEYPVHLRHHKGLVRTD